MNNKTLIYDLETKTFNNKIDPKKDQLRVFGCYSYITNKYYFPTNKNEIDLMINTHNIFVGFNNFQYDNMVLKYNDYDNINENNYGDCRIFKKINIDLMQIFKLWAGSMKIKQGMLKDLLMRYSLDYISKTIGIVDNDNSKIKDFNYDILKKDSWTDDEWKYIVEYTKRDLEITKKLYEWVEKYFEGFKPFLKDYDIKTKKYLTGTPGGYAYKVICNKLDLKEEYQNDVKGEIFGGGYVAYPAGEHFEGDIYCLDFNSLYPHIMCQCNLFSSTNLGWSGNNKFKVKGIYNDKEHGKIEKLLMRFYKLRKEYKKLKDPREYSIKIIINTMYGLSGNPSFKHLYNPTTASDCTLLGRQWVKLARKRFSAAGYLIIYTDTDSVYIKDPFKDKDKMLKVKDDLISEIKSNVPFQQDTFDMGIDDEIKHIWFFKGSNNSDKESDSEMDEDDFYNKPLGLMKKNYIYLTTDNKVKVKNLGVMKKSTSSLTREIFWNHLVDKIKQEEKVKFPKSYFRELIFELLESDLNLSLTRYQVKDQDSYKNNTSIQSQISKMYGSGIHFLIPNKRIGAGKSTKHCTLKEFKENNLKISDIDLSGVWKELNYFIIEEKTMSLSDWGL